VSKKHNLRVLWGAHLCFGRLLFRITAEKPWALLLKSSKDVCWVEMHTRFFNSLTLKEHTGQRTLKRFWYLRFLFLRCTHLECVLKAGFIASGSDMNFSRLERNIFSPLETSLENYVRQCSWFLHRC
jgi:hypothetical protein